MARQLYFDSKDAAVAFAEKNGLEYEVQEHNERSLARPKLYQGYGDNYSFKKKGLPQGGLRSEQQRSKK
jgi:NADH dehydrogenase (ubiquinone) Fe-S protein 4